MKRTNMQINWLMMSQKVMEIGQKRKNRAPQKIAGKKEYFEILEALKC